MAKATSANMTYESWVSRRFDCDYINLGFAGAAKGEDAIVDYMASLDISAFVCDYDHNAPTAEHLGNTLPKVYSRMRESNPDIPIIFVSRPDMHFDWEAAIRSRATVRGDWKNASNCICNE